MELDSLVTTARTVVSVVNSQIVHVEVAAARVESYCQQDQDEAKGSINTKKELKCFQCGEPRLKQWCPQITSWVWEDGLHVEELQCSCKVGKRLRPPCEVLSGVTQV